MKDGRQDRGNPEHPGSLGATDARAQASLLDMYDPDRSQEITNRGTPTTFQNFTNAFRAAVIENGADGGAGVRILTETVTSPTLQAQFRQVASELPNARWIQYEPVNNDNAIGGSKLAFGSPAHTVYRFDQAERVLSLDADIFSGFNPRYMGDAIKTRAVSEEKKDMSRLYVVETTMTLTGAKADHRLGVKPSQVPEIAKDVAQALGVAGASSTFAEHASWIAAMAKDLNEHRGRSLVIAGDNQRAVGSRLAHAMNAHGQRRADRCLYRAADAIRTDADRTAAGVDNGHRCRTRKNARHPRRKSSLQDALGP